MRPGDAASLARYVLQQAPRHDLDPNAVVVVAIQEGISGKVGDNGTSFGPWQLHAGGAYPASAPDPSNQQAANAWAWSPAGVDYALAQMQKVAAGQHGRQAVHSIVYKFERPTNPAAEYNNAVQALPANDGGPKGNGSLLDRLNNAAKGLPVIGPAISTGESAVSDAQAVGSFLENLTKASFWLRALEVVGGGVILMVGIYLLARRVGLAPSATQAASLTPVGRAGRMVPGG